MASGRPERQAPPEIVKPSRIERQYRRYSPETLLKAYEAVKQNHLPVKKAARQFGIPVQTLRDRVKGYINAYDFCIGGETVLSREEEETLVEHVEVMNMLGYGYTNTKLQHVAGELAFDFGRKMKNKPMSNNWLYGFLNRWQTRLASVSPRRLESNRAKCSTPEAISYFNKNLGDTITKYNLVDKPQFIYNLDETGLQPDHRPSNTISSVNIKSQAITSPRSTTTTLIGCVNAIGHAIPPYFIFKGKRFNTDLMEGACVGAHGEMSESGWSNGYIFRKYLKEHFIPYARSSADASQPILLIFDGHTSHISPSLIKWARTQNLIMLVLPAHTSHILQPLDVSLFGPFKSFYYSECSSFMQQNIGRTITRYDICSLACKAYLKSSTPLNIQAGFRKTGIFPFSQEAVPMEKLFPAEGFREDDPVGKVKALKSGRDAVEEFLKVKMEQNKSARGETQNCPKCTCGAPNKVKKPKPSGRVITDDDFLTELEEYESSRQSKGSTKVTETETQSQFDKENQTPCRSKKGKKSKNLGPKKTLHFESPKPSTSGKHLNKTTKDPASDSEFEETVADDDLCCVCKKWSPPNLNQHPGIKLVTWAYCDRCSHCVHLVFCTEVRVVRRHSEFLCPCCNQY